MADFDPQRFPRATRVHWKVLLDEIANTRPTVSRRLAALPSLKDFKGVQIETDKAFVTMGSKGDVKIVRTGPNEITLSGGLAAESLSAQKLTLNGKPLDAQIKQLSSIPAILQRLAKLEAATTGVKDKNKLKLGDKGDVVLERTGAGKAKLSNDLTVGLDLTVGDDLRTKFAKVTDHLTATSIKGSKLNIEGPVRITDDIRMIYPGTIGYVFHKGILKPGQSSPSKYSNPNYWSGNGKISITVCSMHSEGSNKAGTSGSDHVYKVYWNSHGQPYNHYSQPMLSHLKSSDGKLILSGGGGCVFTNNHASHEAYFVIKQLPITSYISTRHAAKGTGAWSF